ncbi:predicted protein [Chaetoceros tenuissimus]|uniref:Uncharacterized protein n=1 Tax=Chaetoceros tenuissimus TaxID=426638 RepID=A0AAD3DBZ0_9STRA|nr:predicted protein [Chaetoceros tenuissimus]
MKLAKAAKHLKKHTGEKETGITVQMRFVPLKSKDDEKEPETETISVAIDDNDRVEGANELKLKVTVMTNLHGQGEQFLDNLISLRNKIFKSKDWVNYQSLRQRLEHIAKFLKGMASKTLHKELKDARTEFLNHCGVDTSLPNANIHKTNEQAFETWLKRPNTLVDGAWLEVADIANANAVEAARVQAFLEYERAIMWNIGKVLWKDHGEAYENHFYYFMHQIVKLYAMSVEEYDYTMKMYAERLKLMQPPSFKKCKTYAEADWTIQEKEVDERCIRRAIFQGLPKNYQKNLRSNYEQDWGQMDEATFVSAMADCELEDRAEQEDKKAEADKNKQINKKRGNSNQQGGGKRGKHNDGKKFCKWCKKAKSKFFDNHNSDDCTMKDKWEKQGKLGNQKELHTIESLAATQEKQTALLDKLIKKIDSADDDNGSD